MATEQQIRDICGMTSTNPSSIVLTRWITLIEAMINRFNSSVDDDLSDLVLSNRISVLWWNMKQNNREPAQAVQKFLIEPLSDAEKQILDNDEYLGTIPMNGNRAGHYLRR